MTISLDITQAVHIGQNPTTNVTVTNLVANSNEMPFASALTSSILEFTNKYRKSVKQEDKQ